MSRTYKNYFVLYPIQTRINKDPAPSVDTSSTEKVTDSNLETNLYKFNETETEVKKGKIFIGSRFTTTLLDLPEICDVLHLVTEQAVVDRYQDDEKPLTTFTLNTQSNAIRLGTLNMYSIALVPKEKGSTIPPYGERATVRIPASAFLDVTTMSERLYDAEFQIEDANEKATYKVEPGSVKQIRLEKLSSRIPIA